MSSAPSPTRHVRPNRAKTSVGAKADAPFGNSPGEAALFGVQHAVLCFVEAFGRYIARQLATVAGDASLSAQDCMILHTVRIGSRPQSITDIQHFLNRTDVANVQYSVKKLIKVGLIERAPSSGRGMAYRLTAHGTTVTARFLEHRNRLLKEFLPMDNAFCAEAAAATRLITRLTGTFEHLSRTDPT